MKLRRLYDPSSIGNDTGARERAERDAMEAALAEAQANAGTPNPDQAGTNPSSRAAARGDALSIDGTPAPASAAAPANTGVYDRPLVPPSARFSDIVPGSKYSAGGFILDTLGDTFNAMRERGVDVEMSFPDGERSGSGQGAGATRTDAASGTTSPAIPADSASGGQSAAAKKRRSSMASSLLSPQLSSSLISTRRTFLGSR